MYQDRGNCFVMLVTPDVMCFSTRRNVAGALANLGRSAAKNSPPQLVDLPIKPKERKKRSPVGGLPSDLHETSHAILLVKRLPEEHFGKTTLRRLLEKLGLDDITPQSLSSSIIGNEAGHARFTIAEALEKDADTLWLTAWR